MSIVTFETLSNVTGKKTPAAVAVKLTQDGIRYFCGKGGRPWTTEKALNEALGITDLTSNEAKKSKIDI